MGIVCIGSFEGIVRIFSPKRGEYKMEDLLIEKKLDGPILQVKIGVFTGDNQLTLAVLHNRKLCVYSVEKESGGHSIKL